MKDYSEENDMGDINLYSLLKNRMESWRGYDIRSGQDWIEAGDGDVHSVRNGDVVAVIENINHDARRVSYEAVTADLFDRRRTANPHLDLTAWFFRRNGHSWDYVGGGRSPSDLIDSFVAP